MDSVNYQSDRYHFSQGALATNSTLPSLWLTFFARLDSPSLVDYLVVFWGRNTLVDDPGSICGGFGFIWELVVAMAGFQNIFTELGWIHALRMVPNTTKPFGLPSSP